MEQEKKIVRCAVYTRKSSEEGLELEFNSLQAQREACEAYIKSQKHEGWQLVEKAYDDGGFSGGNLERPALKELLKDIANGFVDIIVVYKIDRLTRSLMDFSKIVEVLDTNNTSFVSITQQFNTTTSMGRLTLNMLLSFAQFEREVTGERIRDKYAASKKKGMWMGGNPPMGYIRREKKIYPDEHAESVKTIFNKYIELQSIAKVKHWIDDNGIRSQNGRILSAGNVNLILLNRAYLGEVGHKGTWYKGEHRAIISQETYDNVQKIMEGNRVDRKNYAPIYCLLAGKIYDDKGNHMTSSWSTGHKGQKYRYYVSQAVLNHNKEKTGKITKISLPKLEKFVDDWFLGFFKDENNILSLISEYDMPAQKEILHRFQTLYIPRNTERILINRIDLKETEIIMKVYKEQVEEFIKSGYEARPMKTLPEDNLKTPLVFKINYRIGVIDNGAKIIIGSTYNKNINKDRVLIKTILRSYKWNKEIINGVKTGEQIGAEEKMDNTYVFRIVNLSFLSAKIVTAILEGKQPPDLTLQKLLNIKTHNWKEQEKILGF